jgi:two-component system, NarL family, response regulator DegU
VSQAMQQGVIRVLLVGRPTLIRSALAALLTNWVGIEVVGMADPNTDAMTDVLEKDPGVVVLHIEGSDRDEAALQFLSVLREDGQNRRVLVITGEIDPERRLRPVLLGAVGVVHEDQTASMLEQAIRRVHSGEAWLERTVTAEALGRLSGWRQNHDTDSVETRIESLSDRERSVITLLCEGLQNREIGSRLSISEATVRHHLTSIFEKLRLQNRLELVIFACRNNADRLDRAPNPAIDLRHAEPHS